MLAWRGDFDKNPNAYFVRNSGAVLNQEGVIDVCLRADDTEGSTYIKKKRGRTKKDTQKGQ